jgi:hypothetical protein
MSFAAQVHSGAASSSPVALAMAARNSLCASVCMLYAFTFRAAASNSGAASINASGAQCVGVALMYGQTKRFGFTHPSGCP